MLLIVLFTTLLFLTPQAESHVGTAVDHLDSNRLYDQETDEGHRHKPLSLGDPNDDYDRTYPEDVPEYTTAVTFMFFDRDTQLDKESINMTADICREVSTSLFQAYMNANNPSFIRPHPFADEGLYYYTTNAGYLPAVELDFSRNGPAFDYERAPNRTEDGRRYYEYTVTAWESFDMDSPCQSNVEGWKAPDPDFQISRTFRMYVTDVDETINLPPVLESHSLRNMSVDENQPSGTEVCCNAAEVTDRNHEQEELVYELVGEDAEAFRITSGNRVIVDLGGHGNGWIFTTRTLDYETKRHYPVTFRVTDPEGATAERDFTISVRNDTSDDPPSGGGSSGNNRGSGRSGGNSGGSGRSGGNGSSGGSSSSSESSSTEQNGHVDYCRDYGPCSVGEGDCDSNSECQNGLYCSRDIGTIYGFQADYDVCEADPERTQNGHVDYCQDGPCDVGEGDCDGNSQCESGLQCNRDIGAGYGFPPNYDVCEADPERTQNGHVDYCRDFGPCSAGQGDCDSNSECQSGLECNWNVGTSYGFPPKYDVCE